MFFSKKGAKVLAAASAFAFAVTGFSFAPAKLQAAEAPTVNVLGATLRLDAETGTQSLRVGIEVSNADQAKACGIKLKAVGGTKTVTIGTDVTDGKEGTNTTKKHTDMYSIDKVGNKVVYSAVITGIPVAKFDVQFDVKGYVTANTAEAEPVVTTEDVKKSVVDVVEALNTAANDNANTITYDGETGKLVRVNNTTHEKTEILSSDEIFENSDMAAPVVDDVAPEGEGWIPVDLSKVNTAGNKMTYDAGSKSLNVKDQEFVVFKLNDEYSAYRKVDLCIRGTNNTGENFRIWVGGHSENRVSDVCFIDEVDPKFDSTYSGIATSKIEKSDKFSELCVKKVYGQKNLDMTISSLWYRVHEQEATPTPAPTPTPKPTPEPGAAEAPFPAKATLSKENEVIGNTNVVYEDGKAKCALEPEHAGHGFRLLLNGDDGVDLSKYKVVVNYADQKKNDYGMCVSLEGKATANADNWWAYQAPQVSKEGLYTSINESGKWELSADEGTAYVLYIKYNTWVPEGEGRKDAAEFTITSVDFVKK